MLGRTRELAGGYTPAVSYINDGQLPESVIIPDYAMSPSDSDSDSDSESTLSSVSRAISRVLETVTAAATTTATVSATTANTIASSALRVVTNWAARQAAHTTQAQAVTIPPQPVQLEDVGPATPTAQSVEIEDVKPLQRLTAFQTAQLLVTCGRQAKDWQRQHYNDRDHDQEPPSPRA